MNLRTRLALSLIISSLPAKSLDMSRVFRLRDKINKLSEQLPPTGTIDVRELLTMVLDQAS